MDDETRTPVELPMSLRQLTDGTDLEHKDRDAMCLVTVGLDGWPHVALLSVGEVLTTSASGMRVALWPNSTTSANLHRSGQGLMVHVADGIAHYVRLAGRRMDDVEVSDSRLACFDLVAVKVIADRVGYADVLSGITYRLKHPGQVVERWRKTIDRLKPG
jgi:hypothetical protein